MVMRYYTSMSRLREALHRRILVLDGAMGTMIQAADLTAADFGGAALEGCNEHLNLTRPDVVRGIHRAYLEAGADVVSTNTFGCAPYVLGEYGLADRAWEIARAAARLAREAAGDGFVLGAMGPSTRSISVTRNVTFDEVRAGYRVQAAGLLAGGVDALLLETCQDTLNVKAAAIGVREAMREAGVAVPLMVSATIEPMGTMLAGQGVEALAVSLEHLEPFSLGLNCATGPEFMTDHLRSLSALAPGTVPTAVVNNIGKHADFRGGLVLLRIGYSDGSSGVLVVSCRAPVGAPDAAFEGITASKGFVDYWHHEHDVPLVDGNRTSFHVVP
jgi:5-methyltetrahydrofolate--homocysteine methyltransferase